MLIGIISDTHDNAINLLKAVKIFNEKNVGLVIHCGDWVSPFMPDFCESLEAKVISVWGNNEGDIYRFLTRQEKKKWNIEFNNVAVELNIDDRNLIAYHGDSKPLLGALIDSQKYDAVFSGHTHTVLNEMKGKTLHVNPGSTSGLCESKITDNITIATYNTELNNAEIVYL
ncbi:MAG: metallophosphoesterase [Candidatus Pacebacteria bacterium]|nr:metallophosphoesterase [Candidatus Paceibacterota bacterium]